MIRLLLLSLIVSTTSSAQSLSDQLERIQLVYAPDKRVAIFELGIDTLPSNELVLRGKTNLPNALAAVRKLVNESTLDSIQLLPASELGAYQYGIVRQSVANIRSQPTHSGELATQALLGTPLRIYEKGQGDWWRVQTPDGYISWLDGGGFQLVTKAELTNWQRTARRIVTADYTFSYTQANSESIRYGDLVAGAILEEVEQQGAYVQVRYPDGQLAFVEKAHTQPLTNWLQREPSETAALLQTAQQFLGRPYLWGGTSGKGMDCSGFTKTVYYLHGFIIPRDASQQVHSGTTVPIDQDLSQLEPGDFLFFGNYRQDGSQRVTHVGLYLENGYFIHAGADNGAVRIESLDPNSSKFAANRRETLLQVKRLDPSADPLVKSIQDEYCTY